MRHRRQLVLVGALILTSCSEQPPLDRSPAAASSPSTPTQSVQVSTETSGQTSRETSAIQVSGRWMGGWGQREPIGAEGTLTMVLQQQGEAISGTIVMNGNVCLSEEHNFAGEFYGNAFSFSVSEGGGPDHPPDISIRFEGDSGYGDTVSASVLSGDWRGECPAGAGNGSWSAQKVG